MYRQGIAFFDEHCRTRYGAQFASLSVADQDTALTALEGKGSERIAMPAELRDFFGLLLQNVKEGYFADPMYGGNHQMKARVHIGFPGARAAYTEWIGRHNVH